jgi:glycosyltransferase involved in cell wall biosynthesis
MSVIKISVIVPCYNQACYLAEALDSVIAQTYRDWECIIVNDGATDDTELIAKSYLLKDNRFKYLHKENGGLSSARNAGLQLSKGEFIQFLDADDFIHVDKFQAAVDAMSETASAQLVICDFNIYDELSGTYLPPYCTLTKLINLESIISEWDISFTIPIHCGIFKKALLTPFNEELKAKEDWIQWINIFQKINGYCFINMQYASYRRHVTNMTNKRDFMDENTLTAYWYVYNMLDSDTLKDMLFLKYHTSTTALFKYYKTLSDNTRASASYKVGNHILMPLSYTKQLVLKIFNKKI